MMTAVEKKQTTLQGFLIGSSIEDEPASNSSLVDVSPNEERESAQSSSIRRVERGKDFVDFVLEVNKHLRKRDLAEKEREYLYLSLSVYVRNLIYHLIREARPQKAITSKIKVNKNLFDHLHIPEQGGKEIQENQRKIQESQDFQDYVEWYSEQSSSHKRVVDLILEGHYYRLVLVNPEGKKLWLYFPQEDLLSPRFFLWLYGRKILPNLIPEKIEVVILNDLPSIVNPFHYTIHGDETALKGHVRYTRRMYFRHNLPLDWIITTGDQKIGSKESRRTTVYLMKGWHGWMTQKMMSELNKTRVLEFGSKFNDANDLYIPENAEVLQMLSGNRLWTPEELQTKKTVKSGSFFPNRSSLQSAFKWWVRTGGVISPSQVRKCARGDVPVVEMEELLTLVQPSGLTKLLLEESSSNRVRRK